MPTRLPNPMLWETLNEKNKKQRSLTNEKAARTGGVIASQSNHGDSDPAASCGVVTFSGEKDSVPSVRIDGTRRLCQVGGKLEVTVNYAGIPNGGTITAYLQSKNGGEYIPTGARADISPGTSMSDTVTFNMGQMAEGSYRILVVVQESGANILQVPYYFVIGE